MMNPSSWAGVITALATLVTAIGGVIVTFKVMIPNKRINEHTSDQVEQVHVIVNQQRSDMMKVIADQDNFVRALMRVLKAHGIEIPVDQSKPDEEGG